MIIDTPVIVSAVERKDPEAIAAIRSLPGPSEWSFIVAGELASGVEAAVRLDLPTADQEMRAATMRAYSQLSEHPSAADLPLDELSSHFAWLTALCSADRIRLGQNDRWILATALTLGTQVITADHLMHKLGVEADRQRDAPPLTVPVGADH